MDEVTYRGKNPSMNDKYSVKVCEEIVAENMPLEYAWILTKSIFEHFYNDSNMFVTISEMPANDEIS